MIINTPKTTKVLANPRYEYRAEPMMGPMIRPMPLSASTYPMTDSLLSGKSFMAIE